MARQAPLVAGWLLRWLLEDSEARIIRTVVDGYYRDGTPPAIPELTPDQRELAKVLDHHTDLPLALPANDNSSESGQQRPTAATRTSVTYWPAL